MKKIALGAIAAREQLQGSNFISASCASSHEVRFLPEENVKHFPLEEKKLHPVPGAAQVS